jgi:hypothetical protein
VAGGGERDKARRTPLDGTDLRPRVGLAQTSGGCRRENQRNQTAAGADAATDSKRPAAQWQEAAQQLTDRPSPAPRPRKRRGGDGSQGVVRVTARGLVEDYLALCRNPASDVRRWIAEDKKRLGGMERRGEFITRKEGHHHDTASQTVRIGLADAYRLRRQSLPPMRNGLDPLGGRGGDFDGVLDRPRTGVGRYDPLRPVRAEGAGSSAGSYLSSGRPGSLTGGEGSGADLGFGAARSVIRALYAAKIEATRRSLPPSQIAAAVRALRNEQRADMRALAERKSSTLRALREQRAAERFSDRLAQHTEVRERRDPVSNESATQAAQARP